MGEINQSFYFIREYFEQVLPENLDDSLLCLQTMEFLERYKVLLDQTTSAFEFFYPVIFKMVASYPHTLMQKVSYYYINQMWKLMRSFYFSPRGNLGQIKGRPKRTRHISTLRLTHVNQIFLVILSDANHDKER